jgi:hypothetical protein
MALSISSVIDSRQHNPTESLTATDETDNMLHPSQRRFRRIGEMSEVKIDFEWSRAYSSRGKVAYAVKDGRICQVGDRRQSYSPFKLGQIYLEFAQLDGSADACVTFAEKYGLLTAKAALSEPPSEDLKFWQAQIRMMLGNVRMLPNVVRVANSRGTYAKVGKVDVLLVPGEGADAAPVLVMEPGDLLQAMNLEMAHFISGGGRLTPCRNCGLFFQAGRSGGKRAIAQFHSDECKRAFHNSRRGKAS